MYSIRWPELRLSKLLLMQAKGEAIPEKIRRAPLALDQAKRGMSY
jgi:hypothetical protein